MIEIQCRCGRSKMNFKTNIGPFYVTECCLENGFDDLGNEVMKKEKKVEPKIELKPEVKEEVKSEKPKRNYNKNGQVNIKKDE